MDVIEFDIQIDYPTLGQFKRMKQERMEEYIERASMFTRCGYAIGLSGSRCIEHRLGHHELDFRWRLSK